MKKTFMGKDFMLGSETAVRIYEQYAQSLPIIDYHCHINPGEIAENLRYRNIAGVCLAAIIINGGPCGLTAFRKNT